MSETGFSAKRVSKMVLMLLVSVVLPVAGGFFHQTRLAHIIIWVFISLMFFLCFIIYLEHERICKTMTMGLSNDYSLLAYL